MKFPGKRPKNLGAQNGRLAPAGNKPNVASSFENTGYAAIDPISYSGDASEAMRQLVDIIQKMPLTTIINQEDHYLYAECETKLLGFVDDLELLCNPEESVIHVRSASRLGYSDMKVNRQRIEAIRAAFAGATSC